MTSSSRFSFRSRLINNNKNKKNNNDKNNYRVIPPSAVETKSLLFQMDDEDDDDDDYDYGITTTTTTTTTTTSTTLQQEQQPQTQQQQQAPQKDEESGSGVPSTENVQNETINEQRDDGGNPTMSLSSSSSSSSSSSLSLSMSCPPLNTNNNKNVCIGVATIPTDNAATITYTDTTTNTNAAATASVGIASAGDTKNASITNSANHNNNSNNNSNSSLFSSSSNQNNNTYNNNNNNNTKNTNNVVGPPYNTMLQMTLELVHDIVTARVGDTVMTAFGQGQVLSRNESIEIQLQYGKLYVRTKDMIHKVLPEDEYDAAMDQLEQARKYQIAHKCQQLNIPMMRKEKNCIACLLRSKSHLQTQQNQNEQQNEQNSMTENTTMSNSNSDESLDSLASASASTSTTMTNNNNNDSQDILMSPSSLTGTTNANANANANPGDQPGQKPGWWRRGGKYFRSNAAARTQNNIKTPTYQKPKQRQQKQSTPRNKKDFCQVCGNPVCSAHSKKSSATQSSGGMLFCMCIDCSLDLHALEHTLNPHHPDLPNTLQRLVYYYTRMLLQLSFCLPRLQELACHLTLSEQRHSQISLGTSGLGFVGAALGVAGTAAMLTPAGPAIILAAIATSATSGTLSLTHTGYRNLWSNQTTAHQLADKVIGWHGLCLGILQALEQLRTDLLTEQRHHIKALFSSTAGRNRTLYRKKDSEHHGNNGVWNTLAVGGFTTSRHAMTGVSVTSAMGASYSQAINTSLQGIPVVGAAFSVGCMAFDAHNIQSALRQLQKPSNKARALQQVQDSFLVHIPNTIVEEVLVLGAAMNDLHARIIQQTKERDLMDELKLQQDEQDQQDNLERELQELE